MFRATVLQSALSNQHKGNPYIFTAVVIFLVALMTYLIKGNLSQEEFISVHCLSCQGSPGRRGTRQQQVAGKSWWQRHEAAGHFAATLEK